MNLQIMMFFNFLPCVHIAMVREKYFMVEKKRVNK